MKLSYRVASAALAGLSLIGTTAAQSQAFAGPAPASASSTNDASPEAEALINNIKALQSQSTVLEGRQARAWVERVTADIGGKKIAPHLGAGSSLVAEHATVYKFHTGNIQVTLPISDQERGASLNAVYDSSGKLIETLEMQLTHDDKTGRAQVWRNGTLAADKIIKAADLPKDLIAEQPRISALGFSWGKLNSCLSGAGISSWALALIGTACAAACVGTAGAACVPCITAAGGVGAGTVWFCIGKATS
ncbi:hypothetical protein [Streptomyces kronopolitis]